MKKFEYKTMVFDAKGVFGGKIDESDFDHALNEAGRDGWELVQTIASNQSYGSTRYFICVFKREIT